MVKYQDCDNNLEDLLREDIKREFRVAEDKPEWVQNPEWQFNNGKPMEFVGQLEIERDKSSLHDDVVFYVFWDKETGLTKTIIQVA